jgi:hypothetical protein
METPRKRRIKMLSEVDCKKCGEFMTARHVCKDEVRPLHSRCKEYKAVFSAVWKAFESSPGDVLVSDVQKVTELAIQAARESVPVPHPANVPIGPVQAFWDAQAEWSKATFGTDIERGPIGPLKHLEKEAREAQAKPEDELEMADCLFLVFDAARRSGLTLDALIHACEIKLEINKRRIYPKTTDMSAMVEHLRPASAPPDTKD